ncbi:MAG: carboxypeptidase-like regulatory domain-containing protein [Bacteroidia bacterium]
MRTRLFSFILFCLTSITSFSQIPIKGKIVSLPDKQPIAFANIGIINSSIGTIANTDGSFSFKIPSYFSHDSVLFSALGYSKIFIPVSELTRETELTVYLREAPYALSEVMLTAERVKAKIYKAGNRKFDGGSLYADTVMAGAAMALLIQNKSPKFRYPVYIQDAQLRIVKNTFREFKIRVRLLEAENIKGLIMPGKDLLNQSVVVESKIADGWLKIDLSSYQLKMDRDFFLVFEWILEQKDRSHLYQQYEQFRAEHPSQVSIDYSIINGVRVPYYNYQGNFYLGTSFGISVAPSILNKQTSYYRLNSFGRWIPGTSVLAGSVTLSDQPHPTLADTIESEDEPSEEALLSYYKRNPVSTVNISSDSIAYPISGISDLHTRFADPIRIELHRNENQLAFFAYNLTHYPYELIMDFSKIHNLEPVVSRKTYTLSPGVNRLLVLTVTDRADANYHYELSVKELIGDPDARPDDAFAYLIPVGNSRKAMVNDSAQAYYEDQFIMAAGDTVFAMRKGVVTATAGMGKVVDRIGGAGSFEVLHADGTVMVYQHLDTSHVFVQAGETIYPGQALSIVREKGDLQVMLFSFVGEGRVKRMRIPYFQKPGMTISYDNISNGAAVEYTTDIIVKEMTEKEIRSHKFIH